MGALSLVLAVPIALAAAPAAPDRLAAWQPLIAQAAQRTGLPEAWIIAVMRAESGGRTQLDGKPIRSPKGAIGLMQLMPGTWAEMRAALALGEDPDDPRDNILAGAFYLRRMYDRFGYPGLFAAYNAGPARYAAYLAGRASLPGETIRYSASVTAPLIGPVVARPGSAPAPLFVALHGRTDVAAPSPEPASSLFAIRKVTP